MERLKYIHSSTVIEYRGSSFFIFRFLIFLVFPGFKKGKKRRIIGKKMRVKGKRCVENKEHRIAKLRYRSVEIWRNKKNILLWCKIKCQKFKRKDIYQRGSLSGIHHKPCTLHYFYMVIILFTDCSIWKNEEKTDPEFWLPVLKKRHSINHCTKN